ncbi:MAG: hypothetical protein KJI69_04300 [Patescibacteria group bacterium]|nr:hypothetical protein [Patescibacteria group bacterium]
MINISLFLQTIFLQTGNPILDTFNAFTNPQTTAQGLAVTPNYVPVISFILVAFLLIVGLRYIVNARRSPNAEEPIGIIQFVIQRQGLLEGFVNKYDAPVRASVIRALKNNKKFAPAVKKIIELKEAGHLHFYQMFYRDTRDLLTSTVRRSRTPSLVISTLPLDDPDVAYSQSEAKFSWATLGWEHMKTVLCHVSSEKFEVDTVGNKVMDVWIIAPMPIVEEKTSYDRKQGGDTETTSEDFKIWGEDLSLEPAVMQVNVLPYDEDLAKTSSSFVMASKQVDYIGDLEDHMETQQEELQQRDKVVNKQKQVINMLKLALGQKKLIGTELPFGFGRPKDFITWIVLGSLGGLLVGELPRFIPQLAGIDRLFMGAMGTMIIVAVYMMTRKSTSNTQRDLLEEEGINQDQLNM